MKKVIERLEEVEYLLHERYNFGLDEGVDNKPLKKRIDMLAEALAELKAPPRWETPEQWKKRTGEAWPYNSAVYCRGQLDASEDWSGWMINSHRGAVWTYDTFHTFHDYHIVCATRPGPPPNDWKPEEGDHENQKDHAL
jgi:hypothetical protein